MRAAITAGLALLAATANAQPVQSRMDAILAPLADEKSPGFAVLVRQGGRSIFQRGYGVRDLKSRRKIDERTDFRLASFTKQFTAMTIMLLVRDGKLRYDERITDVFPEFPAWGREITVRHLLTHTSGLPDYEDLMGNGWSAAHQIRDEEVLRLVEQQTAPKFAPGTSWAYSNSGYVLLGLIAANVSGEPFRELVADRIFRRLGMTETVMFVKGKNNVSNRAFGHTKQAGGFVETDQSSTSATLGDGGIYSNLVDLAKWDAALDSHALVGEKEMHAALTPVKLNDGSEPDWPATPGEDNLNPGKPVSYGFGWFLDPYHGRPRMWHTGSTVGFRTVIERFPAEKLTVTVLCNRTDVDASALALRLVDALGKR